MQLTIVMIANLSIIFIQITLVNHVQTFHFVYIVMLQIIAYNVSLDFMKAQELALYVLLIVVFAIAV